MINLSYLYKNILLFSVLFITNTLIFYFSSILSLWLNFWSYSLQFEFFFIVLIVFWIFYVCYLMFFTSLTKTDIALKILFFLELVFYSSVIHLILLGYFFNFFLINKFFFFNNTFCLDSGGYFMKLWILIFSILSLKLSESFIKNSKFNVIEFPVLIAFGVLVLLLLVSLIDIFAILIALESISFIMIGLTISVFTKVAIESCIKYFVQNTVITGISIFGIFGIFFICKTTNFYILKAIFTVIVNNINFNEKFTLYVLIIFILMWLFSLLFKLGVFPVHFYVPDLYEAAPVSAIFFISSVIKPVIFFLFFKIYFNVLADLSVYLNYILLTFGIISMFLSNIMALDSVKIKRFLGYTSVSQFGFLLICLTTLSFDLFVFSFIYIFLYNFFLFSILFMFSSFSSFINLLNVSFFTDLGFLFKEDNFFKFIFSFSILAISGLPPIIVFLYKYTIFLTLFFSNYFIFTSFIIILNIISIIYYLKIIKNIWVPDRNFSDLKFKNDTIELFEHEFYTNKKLVLIENIILFTIAINLFFIVFFDFINQYLLYLILTFIF